jgi:uncharacterized protein (DUF2147 family)
LAQNTVIGKWKTIDDHTGKPKSIVEIFEKNQKIYGRVIEIFDPKRRNSVCQNCEGEDANKPINGLIIIKGLIKDGDEYNEGKILDPENGKLYNCYITLETPDKLKVRGFVGISLIGRTQYWIRVKS